MPRKAPNEPPIPPAKRDFDAAIDRIQGRNPRNKKLAKKLKESGELPLTKFNVALEAGRSRTTLDKYPTVLERIEILAQPATSSTKDALRNVRKEKAEAKIVSRQMGTVLAAVIGRMIELEKQLKNAPREVKHIKNNPNPNKVAQNPSRNVTLLRPTDGK